MKARLARPAALFASLLLFGFDCTFADEADDARKEGIRLFKEAHKPEKIANDRGSFDQRTKAGSTIDLEIRAKREFDRAIQLRPIDAESYAWRSLLGYGDDRMRDANDAVRIDPKSVLARRARGKALAAEERWNEAFIDLNEAVRLAPNEPENYLERARAHSEHHQTDRAIADCGETLRVDPRNIDALVLRATLLEESSEIDRALRDLAEAIRIDQKRLEPRIYRSYILITRKQRSEAIDDLSVVINACPREELFLIRGQLLDELDRRAEAVKDYSEMLRFDMSDENRAAALLLRCQDLSKLNKKEEALHDAETAARLIDDPKVLGMRGQLNQELGHKSEAVQDYDKIIRIGPDKLRGFAHAKLAEIHEEDERLAQAISDLDEAVRLDPDQWLHRYTRARLRFAAGRADAADDSRAWLNHEGWRQKTGSISMAIVTHFSDRQAQRFDQAKAILDEAISKCDRSEWQYPFLRYLHRDISAEQVLDQLTDSDDKLNFSEYVALDKIMRGDLANGLQELNSVIDKMKDGFSKRWAKELIRRYGEKR